MSESELYEIVKYEIENNLIDPILWRKSMVLMGDDEFKAKKKYMKLRILDLNKKGNAQELKEKYKKKKKSNTDKKKKSKTKKHDNQESNSAKNWIIGFAVVGFLVLVAIISQSNNNQKTQDSSISQTQKQSKEVSYKNKPYVNTNTKINRAIEKNKTDVYTETKPVNYSSSALSMANLRYCLSEQIRLDSVSNIINNYFQEDIDRYNGLVDDYNGRCENRKYYTSEYTRVKKQVDDRKNTIKQEGLNRFPKPSEEYRESKPSSYNSTSLTRNELRYCMAEKVRLDTIKNKINNYSNHEVDKYNKQSNDYNKLCQNSQYYINDQRYVQKQIDARKSIIQQEGIDKFWTKKETKKSKVDYSKYRNENKVKESSPVKVNKTPSKFSLTIKPIPSDARVQIMNIKPKYYDGMKLKKGKYHIKVSKRGYINIKQWINLAKDEYYTVTLKNNNNTVPSNNNSTRTMNSQELENYKSCIDGRYPSLCKHSWLTSTQAKEVSKAEKRVR